MQKRMSVLAIIVLLSLSNNIVHAFSQSNYTPIVVTFDASDEVTIAAATLSKAYGNLIVIPYNERHKIWNLIRIMNHRAEIIIVGHGSENGISTTNGLLSWEKLCNWINTLSTPEVLFLACNSRKAESYTNRPSIGASGVIDGKLGAYAVAARLLAKRGNIEQAQKTLMEAFSRANQLINKRISIPYFFVCH